MRYLITGGAGFIGSHLAEALLARGDDVVLLDNFSTGRPSNIAPFEDQVRLVHGSVLDPLLVDELVQDCDIVVHLAAAVGVKLIVEQPLRSFVTNIRGAETVLEAAHRYRRKVMIASTSEVYGKSLHSPFSEEDDRVLGSNKVSRWGYSTSKAVDEILAFAYHREKGLPTVILRFFNTVGPRQTPAYGMVLPRLAAQAVAGEPLTVFGTGKQTRCFCHVSDVVDALIRLSEEPRAEGDVFNVGSTEEVSIIDVAGRIIQMTGSSSRVELIPYEDAYQEGFEDMMRRVPDITKIKETVGWSPTHSLDEILKEVIDEAQAAATGIER